MNNTIKIILVLAIGGLVFYSISVTQQRNDLKDDLTHLKGVIDIRVQQGINDSRIAITDSLLKEFEAKQPDTIIKTKIKYKYEKVIDSIYVLPDSSKLRYITRQLDEIYPD